MAPLACGSRIDRSRRPAGATERMSAQVLYGSLVGNVKDSSDAAVAKAAVTATNNGTNQSRR